MFSKTKPVSLTLCVLATAMFGFGCSDEAVVGIDIAPVTCAGTMGGEVNGSISVGVDVAPISFGTITDVNYQVYPAEGAAINLWDADGQWLGFSLACAVALGNYDVVSLVQFDWLHACEAQQAAVYLSGTSTQGIDPTGGIMIIDQTAECVAGRFDVAMGTQGERLTGWFRIPVK